MRGFLVIGWDYRATPAAQLGTVDWTDDRSWADLVVRLSHALNIRELFFLKTCVRREFYLFGPELTNESSDERILRRFKESLGLADHGLPEPNLLRGLDAIRHLFQVTTSLVSPSLGETEIVHQVKSQMEQARTRGEIGSRLETLLAASLRVSKKVRSQTALTKGIVSPLSRVYRITMDALARFEGKRVVFVGAGAYMNRLLPHFAGNKNLELVFVNRSGSSELSRQYSGRALSLAEFLDCPPSCDAIISATSAPGVLIDAAWVKHHFPKRPMFFFDAATPPDMDATIANLAGTCYVNLASLLPEIERERIRRHAAALQAKPVMEAALRKVSASWADLEIAPHLREIEAYFRKTAQSIADHRFGEEMPPGMEAFLNQLTRRLAAVPILGLKGIHRQVGDNAVEAFVHQVGGATPLFKEGSSNPGH